MCSRSILTFFTFAIFALPFRGAHAASPPTAKPRVSEIARAEYASLFELYRHLHLHPELSTFEAKTAERLAQELAAAGCEMTRNVGGHGIVGVLRNGEGPVLLVRTDLDALPVKEQTGLPYASTARTTNEVGDTVDVMHACGHDVHMTVLAGTARVLAKLRDAWRGTVVFIGQPAEERGLGARAMLKDGLFERWPKPKHCLALHVNANLPAGTIGYTEGYMLANVDSVDLTVRGTGGHGAWPHTTKDPIVLAAQIVLALQTIVSRELAPDETAVVTVGSIHGGSKHNIIPDQVLLQLTVRSYSDTVRAQMLEAINRIARGQALAAGLPPEKMPVAKVKDEFTPATYNDPALTRRLAGVFTAWFGADQVLPQKPVTGGEDFSEYGRTADKIPICIFWLGAVPRDVMEQATQSQRGLPSLHSPFFRPDPELTIRTGIEAMTAAALELLAR